MDLELVETRTLRSRVLYLRYRDRRASGKDEAWACGGAWSSVWSVIAVALGVLVLAESLPAGAHARTSCAYSGAPLNAMTMNVTGASDAVITRRGQEITAGEDGDPPEPCVGTIPTASNTDTINVLFAGDHPGAEAQVLLAGGPLAPGATAEAAGAPEIEIQVSGNGSAVSVVGTRGDDQFRCGPRTVSCGAGRDRVKTGRRDRVSRCERTSRR